MANQVKVDLDRRGVGRILRTGKLPALVNRTAERIAEGVRSRLPNDGRGEVVVERYTTDRGAAAVVVKHPQARGLQAKYGIITAATSAVGLRVRAKS